MTILPDPSGLAQSIEGAMGAIGQVLMKKAQDNQLMKILNPEPNKASQAPLTDIAEDEAFRQQFLNMIQSYENETGEMLNPQQLDMVWQASVNQAQKQQQQAKPGYNMQQLAAIAQKNPQLAQMLQRDQQQQENLAFQKEKLAMQQDLAREKRAYETNKPFIEEVNKVRATIPQQEANLMRITNVLGSNDLRTLRNFGAEYLGAKGIPSEFIASASANELKSAVKDAFVADLKSLPGGSRLNQFIESNLLSALQSPLKSAENNQMITEAQKFALDKNKKKVEITDKILEMYDKAGKEPPRNLAGLVDKQLTPYVQERLKELNQSYKDILSGNVKSFGAQAMLIAKKRISGKRPSEGNIFMLSPDGDIKEVPLGMVKQATQAGGRLIK